MQQNRLSKISRSSAVAFNGLPNVEVELKLPILTPTTFAYDVFGADFVDARPDGWAEIRYDQSNKGRFILIYFHNENPYASAEWCYIQLVATYGELSPALREDAANQRGDADEREWLILSPTETKLLA